MRDAARATRGQAGTMARRLPELRRFFLHRYGVSLPDDDAGREDALIYLDHAVKLKTGEKKAANFLDVWCRWMSQDERDRLVGFAVNRSKYWEAEELGNELRLSAELRRRLVITTIRAEGMDDAAMERQRKANKAASSRRSRARKSMQDPAHLSGLPFKPTEFELAVDVHVGKRLITTEAIVDRLKPAFPGMSPETLTRKVNRACARFIKAGVYVEQPRKNMEPRRVRRAPKASAVHA